MSTIAEQYLREHDGARITAAVALTSDLMRDDPVTCKRGYTHENAMIATNEIFDLTVDEYVAVMGETVMGETL